MHGNQSAATAITSPPPPSTLAPFCLPCPACRLTYLLSSSLGKDSKTLMIVQVSPVLSSRQETSCSLTFAARVRNVELGKAGKHGDPAEAAKLKAELKAARAALGEVDKMTEKLAALAESEAALAAKNAALARDLKEATDAAASFPGALADLQGKVAAATAALATERAALKAEREASAAASEEVEKVSGGHHRAVMVVVCMCDCLSVPSH